MLQQLFRRQDIQYKVQKKVFAGDAHGMDSWTTGDNESQREHHLRRRVCQWQRGRLRRGRTGGESSGTLLTRAATTSVSKGSNCRFLQLAGDGRLGNSVMLNFGEGRNPSQRPHTGVDRFGAVRSGQS